MGRRGGKRWVGKGGEVREGDGMNGYRRGNGSRTVEKTYDGVKKGSVRKGKERRDKKQWEGREGGREGEGEAEGREEG